MKTITIALSFLLCLLSARASEGPEEPVVAIGKVHIEFMKHYVDRRIAEGQWEAACLEKEAEWWADRGQVRARSIEVKAMADFEAKQRDKLKEVSLDVVNVKNLGDDRKEVSAKIWSYVVRTGRGPLEFSLAYEAIPKKFLVRRVDGEWKVEN